MTIYTRRTADCQACAGVASAVTQPGHPRGCYDRRDDLDARAGTAPPPCPFRPTACAVPEIVALAARPPGGRGRCSTSCATPSSASRPCGCASRTRPGPRAARRSRTWTISLRHPGHAKVTTSQAGREVGGDYEIWISDGDLVRTYAGAHKLGTQRPDPQPAARPRRPGLCRAPPKVYEPVTLLPAETLPDTFVHPAGYCQNVLATGRCTVTGTTVVDRARGDHCSTATTRARPSSPATDPTTICDRPSTARPASSCGSSRRSASDVSRRCRGHRPRSRRGRCRRRRSISSSRPGRRCSTESGGLPGPPAGAYSPPHA